MKFHGLFLAGLFCAGSVYAQTEPPTLQFTLTNPGARSLGLGGAFAAIADDATAAVANPSGLVQITRPEVSFEARGWADWSDTGIGATTEVETSSDLTTASGVGFLSFVYPRNDWSFAVYRHQVANFETSTQLEGVIDDAMESGRPGFVQARTTSTFEIVTYGFSTAYRFSEKLDVGVGLTYFSGKLSSQTGFSYLSETLEARQGQKTISVDDSDWGLSAGVIWRFHRQISLGGFFRQAPSFSARAEAYSVDEPAVPMETISVTEGKARFPDIFGAGIVYKSTNGAITASAEWDHVRYSLAGGGIFEDTEIEDGDEIHFGFEYAFLSSTPFFAVRGGVWYEPDSQVRFVGDSILSGIEIQGVGRWHLASGFGLAVRHFQFDFGLDLSETVGTISLSAIVSF